jgi:hypothetical protein
MAGPLASPQALATAPKWLRHILVVIAGLVIAPGYGTTSGGPSAQEVCRIVPLRPEEYRALRDEMIALPPIDREQAREIEGQESDVARVLRERLGQALAGRGNTDEQIAAIFALMRSIEAEVGVAQPDTVFGASLTLSLLAKECGDTQQGPSPLAPTDQDACNFGSVNIEEFQALVREMDTRFDPDWGSGIGGRYEPLERELRALPPEAAQEEEMIAQIHALSRSIGAEFDSGGYLWRNYRATYYYRVDLGRVLGIQRHILRWAHVNFIIVKPNENEDIVRLERVLVFLPNIEGVKQAPPRSRSCPPLPILERPPPGTSAN